MNGYMQPNTRELWGGRNLQRPEPTEDPYYAWYARNHDRLRNEAKVLERPNPFGAPADNVMYVGDFRIERCRETGYMFANPCLTTGGAKEFFDEFLVTYFAEVESTFARRRLLSYLPVARTLAEVMPNRGKLLEVGCGSGALMQVLIEEFDFDVEGNEISVAALPYHERRGQKVHNRALEEMNGENIFDGVIMWSVADHFTDPVLAFQTCNRLLKQNGTLVIGNINTDGFDIATIGKDSLVFAPPGRVNFYNLTSLRRQLEMVGFSVERQSTVGKLDVGIVRDYWLGGGMNGRNSFLERLILDNGLERARQDFQDLLVGNNLSGFQTVVARKR